MVKGKHSFILGIYKKEDAENLANLISELTGKDVYLELTKLVPGEHSNISFNSPSIIEISNDLLDYKSILFNEHNVFKTYPANKRYLHNLDGFIDWYRNKYFLYKDYEVIKHIPHSSLAFPVQFSDGGIFGFDPKYNLKMCDIGIDYLFKNIKGIEIKAPYSRLFCDIEKYKDNNKEEMSKFGQGYIYTKYYDGTDIIRYIDAEINGINFKEFADCYYDDYHRELAETIKDVFRIGKKVLLLDLHSYSDEQAEYLGKKGPFPDICIGINDKYFDQKILDLIIDEIRAKGYTYQINYPYSGSILPDGLQGEFLEKNLCSIMLEVNKRIYL